MTHLTSRPQVLPLPNHGLRVRVADLKAMNPKRAWRVKVLWCHVAGSPSLMTPWVYSLATRLATDTPNLSASAACQREYRSSKGTEIAEERLLSSHPKTPHPTSRQAGLCSLSLL